MNATTPGAQHPRRPDLRGQRLRHGGHADPGRLDRHDAERRAAGQWSGTASAAPSTAAALTGTLTIWEAYGASGTSEKDAFDKIVANVKTANPGLTVTVTDVPFNNLFTNFETQAAAGAGPDMYIAPNDSLPSEARDGLLVDVSDLADTLKAAPYNTSDVAINASTVDGKLYEIPESMKAVELFYDKSVLTTPPGDDRRLEGQRLEARLGLRRERRRRLLPVGPVLRRSAARSSPTTASAQRPTAAWPTPSSGSRT